MSNSTPVRLQLSRAKGFDLRALSLATNGLEAAVVARPGRWGNPFNFRSSECSWLALSFGCRGDARGRQEASVRAFREWIDPGGRKRTKLMERQVVMEVPDGQTVDIGPKITAGEAPSIDDVQTALRGKNLACWCKAGEPCHADVLLEIANR